MPLFLVDFVCFIFFPLSILFKRRVDLTETVPGAVVERKIMGHCIFSAVFTKIIKRFIKKRL
jgi:hypothetical protein